MEDINARFPGIVDEGDRIWNLDETNVDPEFGRRVKVLCDSSSHHGGSRPASTGTGRHVTAVVAASASGRVCPPFFLVQGKQVISNWFQPLQAHMYSNANGALIGNLISEGWFPEGGVVLCTEKGSMDMTVLPFFIKHLNTFVRQFVAPEVHYLLTLDGHGSRKGMEWVEECVNNNCEVVVAPANASHFLQPCDQAINKTFNRHIRDVRDELMKQRVTDTTSIGVKLMCGVRAFQQITIEDCASSFCKTGIFPFQRNFARRFKLVAVIDLVEGNESRGQQKRRRGGRQNRFWTL